MSAILRIVTSKFRNIIFEKYNESPEPNNSLYINKGNGDIVNLCISILIYFMEFKNQTDNKEGFHILKNFKVHNTQYTEVFAQLVTINGKIYVGLQGKCYCEDQNNKKLKSILLPIEAWTTFVSQAVPTLDKAIKEHHSTHPTPPPETTTSRKRPYSNGILALDILTLFHFRTFSINSSFDISSSF